MIRAALLAAAMALAGCGADGPPRTHESGVTVSGEARIGVVGTF